MEELVNAAAVVNEVVDRYDGWLEWLEIKESKRWYPWSPAEERELRRWFGWEDRKKLTTRISIILKQETGDPTAERSVNAVIVHANQMGLAAYNGDDDEMCLSEAARIVGTGAAAVAYWYLFDEATRGNLPTVRKGKQRYVKVIDLAVWYADYRERARTIFEIADAVSSDEYISKQAAMCLAGLSETHLTRLLRTGVIEAVKIPNWQFNGGTWAVERRSVEAFVAARDQGNIAEYLRQFSRYIAEQKKNSQEISRLRRAQRLGRRDPLTKAESQFLPGCFLVKQLASHVGLSTQSVYNAARRGDLKLEEIVVKGKTRYGVKPEEARRFAAWIQKREHGVSRYHNRQRKLIREAGLLTVDDLVRRWGKSKDLILRYRRFGFKNQKLVGRNWSRYLVFERADVETFEQAAGLELVGGQ